MKASVLRERWEVLADYVSGRRIGRYQSVDLGVDRSQQGTRGRRPERQGNRPLRNRRSYSPDSTTGAYSGLTPARDLSLSLRGSVPPPIAGGRLPEFDCPDQRSAYGTGSDDTSASRSRP